ncbi:sirohydrochlorin chelatase [Nocardia halotolerans]
MTAVVADVAAARPDRTVRLAFLDLSAPSVDQVVDELAAQGHTDVIVVPLLLGNAFHARVDLPALLAEAGRRHPRMRLEQTDVLGRDALLIEALWDRVVAAVAIGGHGAATAGPLAGLPNAHPSRAAGQGNPMADHTRATRLAENVEADGLVGATVESLGIVVAAVGSRQAAANVRTAAVARRLSAATGIRTELCFATVEPGITTAMERLRARGAAHLVVAPWFLAPGLLTDRLLAAAPEVVHADVIGAHPALTEVIWARYDSATATELELSA